MDQMFSGQCYCLVLIRRLHKSRAGYCLWLNVVWVVWVSMFHVVSHLQPSVSWPLLSVSYDGVKAESGARSFTGACWRWAEEFYRQFYLVVLSLLGVSFVILTCKKVKEFFVFLATSLCFWKTSIWCSHFKKTENSLVLLEKFSTKCFICVHYPA